MSSREAQIRGNFRKCVLTPGSSWWLGSPVYTPVGLLLPLNLPSAVLLAEGTPTQRAEETHTHPDTVRTFLRRFRQEGMLGLIRAGAEAARAEALSRAGAAPAAMR